MKNKIAVLLAISLSTLFLTGCFLLTPRTKVSKDIGIKLPTDIVVEYYDGYGGGMGDGEAAAIIEFNKSTADLILEQILNNKDWQALPMNDNLEKLMYDDINNGGSSSYNFSEFWPDLKVPIEEGFWFFNNRHDNAKDPKDVSKLFSESFNFTIAIYDSKEKTLYYLKFDS